MMKIDYLASPRVVGHLAPAAPVTGGFGLVRCYAWQFLLLWTNRMYQHTVKKKKCVCSADKNCLIVSRDVVLGYKNIIDKKYGIVLCKICRPTYSEVAGITK